MSKQTDLLNLTDAITVDSSNNVGIGTSSPDRGKLHIADGNSDIDMDGSASGQLHIDGNGYGFAIALNTEGAQLYTNSSSRGLIFGTNETERMRVTGGGDLLLGKSTTVANTTGLMWYGEQLWLTNPASSGGQLHFNMTGYTSGTHIFARFKNDGSTFATISTNNGTSVNYNTTSDYRLKENVVPLANAADRLAQIPVHRFNFTADPDHIVDGFLAHEIQTVVPEAVTGTKDAVDADGNPEYQGIDQGKLIPLLTAALQEALTKIDALETRITALEAV